MLNEAEQLIAQGFHNDAFNVVLQEMHFKESVDFWLVNVLYAYKMVLITMYWQRGNVDGHAINVLETNERTV